jgi:hypothetical protein
MVSRLIVGKLKTSKLSSQRMNDTVRYRSLIMQSIRRLHLRYGPGVRTRSYGPGAGCIKLLITFLITILYS